MKTLYLESKEEDVEPVPVVLTGPSKECAFTKPSQEKEVALTVVVVHSGAEEGAVDDVIE